MQCYSCWPVILCYCLTHHFHDNDLFLIDESSFGKSSAGYLTWIVAGVLISEGIFGYGTDYTWNYINNGKTYASVDWTQFAEKEEEDDDDDDDDDDDEEDDE